MSRSIAAYVKSACFTVLFAVLAVAFPWSSHPAHAAGSGPTPGIGIQRLGGGLTAYQNISGYDRYPTVIVDRDHAAAAASLPSSTRVLVYHAGVDINVSWNTGVTYQDALNNGWLLKDSAGNYIHNAGYPDNYIADIGNAAYQQRWASNVASYLASIGADGVYIDDILGDAALLTNNIWPVKYPNHTAWNDAMASFVAYVGPYMKSQGYYVAINAKNFIPGDAGSNDGSNDVAWWQRLAPNVNGLVSEYWQQNPNGVSQTFSDCACSWTGWWSKWQRLMTTAQAGGADFYSLVYGSGGDMRTAQYEKASFLMDWNGRGGGMIWNPLDTADPWTLDWTADLGSPSGARFSVGVGWRRDFSGGTALINPSASSSQTFSLGATYVRADGALVTSVTLAPLTAIMLKLSGATSSPTPTAPTNSALPAIGGTAQTGQQLTVSNGTWTGTVSGYTYQWSRCDGAGAACSAISGATSASYGVTTADVAHTLRATVFATNTAGSTSATSAPSGVATDVATAPVNSTLPAISGTAQDGQQLTVSNGGWTGTVTSYAYQWSRCDSTGASCAAIANATSAAYGLTSADVTHTLRATVVAANGGGSTSARTAPSPVVAAAPAPAPSASIPVNSALPLISGQPVAGKTLTASAGQWVPATVAIAYQWQRCTSDGSCASIANATSGSYSLTGADTGYSLRVLVTATNEAGSAVAASLMSGAVRGSSKK
jgi:hypothetical protein